MSSRRALSLVETLVVLGVLAALMGLLLPAVQSARETAREAVCRNNLHQLNLAVGNYSEAHRRLPPLSPPDQVGGWCIEILPFMEHASLHEMIPRGATVGNAPSFLRKPPSVFLCPTHLTLDEDAPGNTVHPAHYFLEASSGRESFSLYETPIELSVPWASGPELNATTLAQMTGPHNGGYFYSRGFQQGVGYLPAGGR